LRIKTRRRSDGPKLPIEFARISKDARLTLVIHSGSGDQPVYWAISKLGILDEARRNLKERENTKLADIHCLTTEGKAAEGVSAQIKARLRAWLAERQEIRAAIWTALPSNWHEKRGCALSPEDAVRYLRELENEKSGAAARFDGAREHIRNTPSQMQTCVRVELHRRGWQDAKHSRVLFDD